MAEDLSGNYEVVLPITLDGAKGPITEGTVELGHDDAVTFLYRGFVREPGQSALAGQAVSTDLTEVRDTPIDDPNGGTPPDPNGGTGTDATGADASLVELVGEAPAEALAEKGITTVEQATAATAEELDAIPGVGTKTVEKIRERGQA